MGRPRLPGSPNRPARQSARPSVPPCGIAGPRQISHRTLTYSSDALGNGVLQPTTPPFHFSRQRKEFDIGMGGRGAPRESGYRGGLQTLGPPGDSRGAGVHSQTATEEQHPVGQVA
jgi:hypothetical protein